jgi:hypothetical protein
MQLELRTVVLLHGHQYEASDVEAGRTSQFWCTPTRYGAPFVPKSVKNC